MANAHELIVCILCMGAAEDTARHVEGLVDSTDVLRVFAARYGDHFVCHRCSEDELDDDDIDCCCACESVTGGVDPIEAVESVLETDLCDECYEYTMEYMDANGMSSEASSKLVVKVMAQRHGGDIPDHSCEAEDDEDVKCRCGCRR